MLGQPPSSDREEDILKYVMEVVSSLKSAHNKVWHNTEKLTELTRVGMMTKNQLKIQECRPSVACH